MKTLIKKLSVTIIVLNLLTVYAYSFEKLFVVDMPVGKWVPNTTLQDGLPAFFYKNNWYLCCKGGLIRYNDNNNKIDIFRLPGIKSEYPKITGIALVNNALWISMMRDVGIMIYDLEKQSFTGSFSMAKSSRKFEVANLLEFGKF